MTDIPYRSVVRHRVYGSLQIGAEIRIALDGELTEEEQSQLNNTVHELVTDLWYNRQKIIHADYIQETKDKLLGLFPSKIYAEEIPNEYFGKRATVPWFKVTTEIGHFKIGWRKRVIVVDWNETTNTILAEDLFPEAVRDNITIEGRMIHAWGYEKAEEYIKRILESA